MKEIHSALGDLLLGLETLGESVLCVLTRYPVYSVFVIREGSGVYHADFGAFDFKGPSLLFSTLCRSYILCRVAPYCTFDKR